MRHLHRDRRRRISTRDDLLGRVPRLTRLIGFGSLAAVAATTVTAAATAPGHSGSAPHLRPAIPTQSPRAQPTQPAGSTRHHRLRPPSQPPAPPPPAPPPPVATTGGS
jgi:hypothetical protein